MKLSQRCLATLLLAVSLGALNENLSGVLTQAAIAVQLRDGKTYFTRPPVLLDASATFNNVSVWRPTYYFTIALPADAGEPLQKIIINQHEGGDDVQFDDEDNFAYGTDTSGARKNLVIEKVEVDRQNKTVIATFNPPAAPGQTITLGLRPQRNPDYGGVYLFGVNAFPIGMNPHGQFLGYARLHFYDHNDLSFGRGGFR